MPCPHLRLTRQAWIVAQLTDLERRVLARIAGRGVFRVDARSLDDEAASLDTDTSELNHAIGMLEASALIVRHDAEGEADAISNRRAAIVRPTLKGHRMLGDV